MLGSKDNDTIINSDIYDTYKDLCLSEKERVEKLLQGIKSAMASGHVWVQKRQLAQR